MGAQSESKAVPRVSEFYLHDKGSEARVFQDGKIIIYTKKKKKLSQNYFFHKLTNLTNVCRISQNNERKSSIKVK